MGALGVLLGLAVLAAAVYALYVWGRPGTGAPASVRLYAGSLGGDDSAARGAYAAARQDRARRTVRPGRAGLRALRANIADDEVAGMVAGLNMYTNALSPFERDAGPEGAFLREEIDRAATMLGDDLAAYVLAAELYGDDVGTAGIVGHVAETEARLRQAIDEPPRVARIAVGLLAGHAGRAPVAARAETADGAAAIVAAAPRTADPQAAHDTAVVSQVQGAIAGMAPHPAGDAGAVTWALGLADDIGPLRDAPVAAARLARVAGAQGTLVVPFGVSVAGVLSRVRARAEAPENRGARAQIEENVAAGIRRTAREGTCDTRIVDEIVASLATLDTADPTRGMLYRSEELSLGAMKMAADAAAAVAAGMAPTNPAAAAYLSTGGPVPEFSEGQEDAFRTAATAAALAAAAPTHEKMRDSLAAVSREHIVAAFA